MSQRLLPRKQPRQPRAEATCAAILAAAARILTSAPERLNTNFIARTAGISIGSFYRYFPGKEAVLAAMIAKMRAEMLADVTGALAAADDLTLQEALPRIIAASLAHHRADPALSRALERAQTLLPPDPESAAMQARLAAIIADFLTERGLRRTEEAAGDLLALCHGMAAAATARGEADWPALTARMMRAARGYLFLGRPT